MAELKAGGLALVLDDIVPENIGKCVTLIRRLEPLDHFTTPDGRRGMMPSGYGVGWLCSGDLICIGTLSRSKLDFKVKGWAIIPPKYLMPIDGDDFQREVEQQKELSI